jgi:ATP-dependent Lon protease
MTTLPVLPLTDAVLLPGMVIPVTLDQTTQAAIDAARTSSEKRLLAVPRLDGEYGSVGTIATIEKVGRLPTGEPAAVIRGIARARIGSGVPGPGAALWVEAAELTEPAPTGRTRELAREYKTLVTSLLQRRGAWQVIDAVERMTDPAELADSAGYAPWLSEQQKVELLSAPDVTARLELLVGWAREHVAEQEVAERINEDVREGLEKSQREFLLRQQLAAIRKELGEDEPEGSADYRTRVEGADLPEKVREAALREVDKLERASDASPEVGWIRTWLDTVLDVPWNTRTEDNTDLAAARTVLDTDHAGLDDVKERILEYPRCATAARPAACTWSAGVAPARSWPSPARPASARPASASPSPARSAGNSSGCRSAASVTRRRSEATGVRTSARCPAASSAPCARPVR